MVKTKSVSPVMCGRNNVVFLCAAFGLTFSQNVINFDRRLVLVCVQRIRKRMYLFVYIIRVLCLVIVYISPRELLNQIRISYYQLNSYIPYTYQ